MKSLGIGEYVTFRSWDAFLDGCKNEHCRQYLALAIQRHIEVEDLILLEVLRETKNKWLVYEICTENDNAILEDYEIYLDASTYDTKRLLAAKPTKWYNALLGEQTEYRIVDERKEAWDE